MIAGDKRKLYPVALALESAFCCKRMEMPVEAPFYFVLDEDIIYFGAYPILRYRRIVEKHDRLAAERDSAFYRCAEPSRLAQKNFFVRVLLRVKEPAASAADGDIADGHRAVWTIESVSKPFSLKKFSIFRVVFHQ